MFRTAIVMVVIGFLAVGTSLAALCDKCKDKMFIMSMGHCKSCSGRTTSGGYKLCAKCSAEKGVCQACNAKLGGGADVKDPADSGKPAPASKPATEPAAGSTDPQGLPVEAKLVTEKDTYALDPKQSGKEFAEKLKESQKGREAPPEPPAVSMMFKLTNTGKTPITVPLGADSSSLTLKLDGPGAVTIRYMRMMTKEFRMGKETVIEPGKSLDIPIAKLLHGLRGKANASYWTEPGEYTLTAIYSTPVEGLDAKRMTVTAAPVKIKVEEGKPAEAGPAKPNPEKIEPQ